MKTFLFRITAVHTICYFLAGLFALYFLGYDQLFSREALSFMRDTGSPWVAAGPALQLVRGVLLGIILYPFRSVFIGQRSGWWKLWLLLFGLSYLLTLSPAIGSFEGLIYTNIPPGYHLVGLPEIILYISLFTFTLLKWYAWPRKAVNVVAIVLMILILFFSTMGMLDAAGMLRVEK